jgi:hypothetical protein
MMRRFGGQRAPLVGQRFAVSRVRCPNTGDNVSFDQIAVAVDAVKGIWAERKKIPSIEKSEDEDFAVQISVVYEAAYQSQVSWNSSMNFELLVSVALCS